MDANTLYYGDNLDILRRYVDDESVDLIYLDPPFNSKQAYNVLFEEPNGSGSGAQIQAFEDTWHWDPPTAELFEQVVESGTKRQLGAVRRRRPPSGTVPERSSPGLSPVGRPPSAASVNGTPRSLAHRV